MMHQMLRRIGKRRSTMRISGLRLLAIDERDAGGDKVAARGFLGLI